MDHFINHLKIVSSLVHLKIYQCSVWNPLEEMFQVYGYSDKSNLLLMMKIPSAEDDVLYKSMWYNRPYSRNPTQNSTLEKHGERRGIERFPYTRITYKSPCKLRLRYNCIDTENDTTVSNISSRECLSVILFRHISLPHIFILWMINAMGMCECVYSQVC